MTGFGRSATIGAAALVAATWAGGAQAQDARGGSRPAKPPLERGVPAAAEPAVSSGTRTMAADELARAGRAVEGSPATTIYRAVLPDGTFELSDRPPGPQASDVGRLSYALPESAVARQRAEAEREHWLRQAEAFNRRQAERERAADREGRQPPAATVVIVDPYPRRFAHNIWGWPQYEGVLQPELPAQLPAVGVGFPGAAVAPVYRSSPGAAQGRSTGGFIGSGFSTAR